MHTIVHDAFVVELEQNAQIVAENETECVASKKNLKQEKDRPTAHCIRVLMLFQPSSIYPLFTHIQIHSLSIFGCMNIMLLLLLQHQILNIEYSLFCPFF